MSFPARRAAALEAARQHAHALLVTNPTNVRYLTGFTGSNGQLLVAGDAVFLTDGRYTEQSANQVGDLRRKIYMGDGLMPALTDLTRDLGVRNLAFESAHVTVATYERLSSALEGVSLVATKGIVETLRGRKDADEVDAIRRAQKIAEQALVDTLGSFDQGTELDLAMELEWAMRTGGAEGLAFDVIVAAGPHAALPHATPRTVPIGPDEVLLIDMGARVDGYCSDMTRTFLRGAPDPMPRAHAAVVRALEAACSVIRAGASGRDVDLAARELLAHEGFSEAFVHSTGHGLGLDIHEESGRLAPQSAVILEPGMAVTVEPGVYLPGIGGVRVEDLVIVTEDGFENLTSLPRGPELPEA